MKTKLMVGLLAAVCVAGLTTSAVATPYDLTGTFGGVSVVGSGDITSGLLTSGSITISGAAFNGTFDWAPPTSDRALDGTDIIFNNLISLSSTPMLDSGGLGFGYDLLAQTITNMLPIFGVTVMGHTACS